MPDMDADQEASATSAPKPKPLGCTSEKRSAEGNAAANSWTSAVAALIMTLRSPTSLAM